MTDTPIPRRVPMTQYEPYIGKVFSAHCDPESVPLTLVGIEPKSADFGILLDNYSVTFRSAPDALLVAGIYVLSAPGFGTEPVFLSPYITPRTGEPGYYYQAIYN